MAFGMPVGELLQRISSPEIAEWMAFERAFGPIGNEWRDEAWAQLIDEIRRLTWVLLAVNENDPAEPEKYPRPNSVYPDPEAEEEAEQQEEDEAQATIAQLVFEAQRNN